MKKAWHPGTLANQKVLWEKQQAAIDEAKKTAQLKKEIRDERDREEMMALQSSGKNKKPLSRLEWMYSAGPSTESEMDQEKEAFLLGKKKVDRIVEQAQTVQEMSQNYSKRLDTVYGLTANSTRDMAAKVRDDPMLMIKRQEQSTLKAVLDNPHKMKQLREAKLAEKAPHPRKMDQNDSLPSRPDRRRSPSPPSRPDRRRSPSPPSRSDRRRAPSPPSRSDRRIPHRGRSPSPPPKIARKRSPSPDSHSRNVKRRSPSPPVRNARRSPSPDSHSRNIRRRSPSPDSHSRNPRRRSPSPDPNSRNVRRRSPSPDPRNSTSNRKFKRRSPSPDPRTSHSNPSNRNETRHFSNRMDTPQQKHSYSHGSGNPQSNSTGISTNSDYSQFQKQQEETRQQRLEAMKSNAAKWDQTRSARVKSSQLQESVELADELQARQNRSELGAGESFLADLNRSHLASNVAVADIIQRRKAYNVSSDS